MGNGRGDVQNCCDALYELPVLLHAFVHCGEMKSNAVRYTVGTTGADGNRLHLYASGSRVKTVPPDFFRRTLVVHGKGLAKRYVPCKPRLCGEVCFTLTVRKTACGYEFRMETVSGEDPRLNHDSGFVKVQRPQSDLQMLLCC